MNYTLITRKGNICKFYLREMAETYKMIYGGLIIETKNNSKDVAEKNTNKG